MSTIFPCGSCSACERCEALRWACRTHMQYGELTNALTALRVHLGAPPHLVVFREFICCLLDPTSAAELLRVLLEARGADVTALDVAAWEADVRIRAEGHAVRIGTRRHGWLAELATLPALILALLAIPPGEQREAAMRAVEAAR